MQDLRNLLKNMSGVQLYFQTPLEVCNKSISANELIEALVILAC